MKRLLQIMIVALSFIAFSLLFISKDYLLPRLAGYLYPPLTQLPIQLYGQQITYRDDSGVFKKPVSIDEIEDDSFIVANYDDLFVFNRVEATFTRLRPTDYDGYWNPTGVYVDETDRIWVANYQANNTLVGTIVDDTYVVERVYEGMISPEGVTLLNDLVITANYDGQNVTAFDQESGALRWEVPIGQAHGVTAWNGKIYATGLYRREVVEIDANGQILRHFGIPSWDGRFGFLWPTSVLPYDDNRLIISDAHTGRVMLFDIQQFRPTASFGGNGIGFQWFNMPYTAIRSGDEIVVTSTFQNRLSFTNVGTGETVNYVQASDDWEFLEASVPNHEDEYNEYVWTGGPQFTIWGRTFNLGYKLIVSTDEPKQTYVFIDETGQHYYFLDYIASEHGGFLFANNTTKVLYVASRDITYVIPVQADDFWYRIDNTIYTRRGEVDLSEYETEAETVITELQALRREDGSLPIGTITPMLVSGAAQAFYDAFTLCDCVTHEMRDHYTAYVGRNNFFEEAAISMISGTLP